MKTPKHLAKLFLVTVMVPGLAAAFDDDIGRVKVMTRNMYIGADTSPIAEAALEEIPFVTAELYAKVQASNPAERIDEIASEIGRTQPDLIGLQEAMLIRTQDPSDALFGGTTPATEEVYDFLGMLQEDLEARGLQYEIAAELENIDVELPAYAPDGNRPWPFIDVRVTDRLAILARSDVSTSNVFKKHYDTLLTLPIPGQPVDYLRGFIALEAEVRGHHYNFVNTHLETDLPFPGLYYQSAQAQELLLYLSTLDAPLIITGDLNSGPQHPLVVEGIPSPYGQFLNAGLVDAWSSRWVLWKNPGYTCCQDELLRNLPSSLDRRIDFVWLSNGQKPVAGLAWRVGAFPFERTDSGLWPSDHAGVVAKTYFLVND
jgi:endonuclease/exonuclease/phosphatase family metal-dependent hydrolase